MSACDPNTLMQAAACFDKCIPPGMMKAIQTYLLCQIFSTGASCPQDSLLRLTPPMTNGLGGVGINPSLTSSAVPFTGTAYQYLGTSLPTTLTIVAAASPNLVSVDFPNLVTIISSATAMSLISPSLTTVNFPQFVPTNSRNFIWGPAPINAASVNAFLARLVANPAYVIGTVNFANAGVAAPTGQGLIDKTTLQGRGIVVNTN